MNDGAALNDVVARFRTTAIEKGAEGGKTDHQLYDRMVDAYHQMLAAGNAGIDAFRRLSDDADPHVQSWVASQLLYDGDQTMVAILQRIAQRDDMIGFNASMVLREHNKGTLGSPLPQLPEHNNADNQAVNRSRR